MKKNLSILLFVLVLAALPTLAGGICGPELAGSAKILSVTTMGDDAEVIEGYPVSLVYTDGLLASGKAARGEVRMGDRIEHGLIENRGSHAVLVTVATPLGPEVIPLAAGQTVAIGIKRYSCRCICQCAGVNADVGGCGEGCAGNNGTACINEYGNSGTLSGCQNTWVAN